MSILNEDRVLVLNNQWRVINQITVQQAFSMMSADAATALDDTDGCFVPTKFDDWLKLPVRPPDDSIGVPRGRVRIPRVIIAKNFAKVVAKRPRLTMARLRERDQNKCALTGKVLKPDECSMEHVVPRSKGGKREWENIVLADRRANSERGNKDYHEAGIQLKVKPSVPKAQTAADKVRNKWNFPEWDVFLQKHT